MLKPNFINKVHENEEIFNKLDRFHFPGLDPEQILRLLRQSDALVSMKDAIETFIAFYNKIHWND